MKRPVRFVNSERLAAVSLDVAHLCQDCSLITAGSGGHCTCGSRSILRLAPILNREPRRIPPSRVFSIEKRRGLK